MEGEDQSSLIAQIDPSLIKVEPMQLNSIELPPPQVEGRTKRHFSQDEDKMILAWVHANGATNWSQLAAQMDNRNARQCRDRFRNYLSPSVSCTEWTPQEDQTLVSLVAQCGNQWAQFVKVFPGRTDVNIKNHWNKLQRHSKKLAKANNDQNQLVALMSAQIQDQSAQSTMQVEQPPIIQDTDV